MFKIFTLLMFIVTMIATKKTLDLSPVETDHKVVTCDTTNILTCDTTNINKIK